MILRKVASDRIEDCQRIKDVLYSNGIDERLCSCETLWNSISFHNHRCDWQPLPKSDLELWEIISEFCDIVE